MSYIGKNPAVRSITCIGFANFAAADASTKRAGRLVYVIDEANFYKDTGLALEQLGSGGLDKWVTGEDYDIDAVIWNPSDYQIYVCNTAHTSSPAFATDAANWDILSFTDTKLLNQMLSTGVVDMPVLSAGTVGTFSVSAGKAVFVDTTTDPDNPTSTEVDITAKTNVAITNLATQPVTYVMATSSDTILQLSSFPTPEQRRDNAFLGVVVHSDNVNVNAINNIPDFVLSPMAQLFDLMRGLGAFNLEGNKIEPNGTNLSFNKLSGSMFKAGVSAASNPKNPNQIVLPSSILATFRYRLQNGDEGADVTVLDPTTYDNGGVDTAVPNNNNATIQRVYVFPSNAIRLQKGQEVFSNLAAAVDAVGKESFVTEDNIKENGLLLASIVIRKGATDLSDPSDAQIFLASRFGELGSVGSKFSTIFQDIYENSPVPQIVLDAIRGQFRIADNATPIGTNLLEITNNNGANKYLEVSADRTAVKDRDERHVLRKESNATYIEDFKENNPTDVITGLGSWTVSNETLTANGKLRGYQSAKLTQVAGSLGATREIVGIPLTNEEIGSEMGLVFPFRYDGSANDLKVEILQSDDGVTYDVVGEINGALTLPRSLETSYAKLNGQFRTDAVFKGFRFTVLTENIGAELVFDNVRFITDPLPTAEFVQTESFRAYGYAGRGSVNTCIPYFSNVVKDTTGDLVTVTNDSTTDGGGLQIRANKKCVLTNFSWNNYSQNGLGSETGISLNSDQLSTQFASIDAADRLGYSRHSPITGETLALTASTGIELEAGDVIRPHTDTTNPATADNCMVSFAVAANSTNVIFKGAEVNNTVTTYANPLNPVRPSGVFTVTEMTQTVQKGKWYKLDFSGEVNTRVGNNTITVELLENGNSIAYQRHSNANNEGQVPFGISKTFQASDDGNVIVQFSGLNGSNQYVYGDSGQTFLQLTPTEPPILAVPITELVENVYSARLTTTPTVVSQSSPFIESIVSDVANEFLITWKAGFFTEAPVIVSMTENNSDVDVQYNWSSLTSTSVRVHGVFGTSSTGVRNFTIVVQRQGADYKPPQLVLNGNAPLSNGQSNGTEYWTGRMLDGRKVMARSYKLSSTITADSLIATIDSGLDVINAINYLSDIFTLYRSTGTGSSLDDAHIYYRKTTGQIRGVGDGSYSLFSGMYFTIEYLQ